MPPKTSSDKNKTRKHDKCPPEICPTGDCGRNLRWNVKTQKCIVKPYQYWPVVDGFRQIPEDVKYMVGEEAYKKEYEDKVGNKYLDGKRGEGKIGEPIKLIPVPENIKIQIVPKLTLKPQQQLEPQPGVVVVRKQKKISISSKPLIIERLAIASDEVQEKDNAPTDSDNAPIS